MRIRILSTFALGFFALGCGGDTDKPRPAPNWERPDLPPYCSPIRPVSDSVDPGSGPVDCRALDGYELLMLDDFENPSSTGWYVNNDRTAEQTPAPDEDPPRTTSIPNGRCVGATRGTDAPTLCDSPTAPRGSCTREAPESRGAMRVRSGLLSSNGGQLGRDLSKVGCTSSPCFEPGPPEVGPCSVGLGPSRATFGCRAKDDTSDWDGIVLWARVAPGSAAFVRVRAADGSSDDKGCVCDPYTSQNDSSTGCDKWGTYLNLDSTFRAYLVPFTAMQQGGWGLKAAALDTSNLFSLGIEWGRGRWDLWIDDVGFYRSRQ